MMNEILLPEGHENGEPLFPETGTENAEVLREAPSAAPSAPVRGVNGGGSTTPPERSAFEQGFDEASCW